MSLVTDYVIDRLITVARSQPDGDPLWIVDGERTDGLLKIPPNSGYSNDSYGDDYGTSDVTPQRENSESLEAANIARVQAVDTVGQSIRGTQYRLEETDVVEVRVEGLDASKCGHIDETGTNGVRWTPSLDSTDEIDEPGLVRQVKQQIMADRTYPDVYSCYGARHITIEQDTSENSLYTDHYRHDFQFGFDRVEQFDTEP